MADRIDGQQLLERIEGFFRTYVLFPERVPDAPLVLALFAINTWIYQVWTSTPYLSLQAATPGAAKSVTLECLSAVSFNSEYVADPTAASLFRLAESHQGWMTLCYDDAQKLGTRSAAALLPILLPGYRQGATVPRASGAEGVIRFPVYWPKAFSLIGDLVDTLRSRSIVIPLERASRVRLEQHGVKTYRRDAMEMAASALVPHLRAFRASMEGEDRLPVTEATWFDGREEELWTPLLSTLSLLHVDAETVKRFRIISADLSALKTQDAVQYSMAQKAEDDARDQQYGERAVRDLARIVKEDENGIASTTAVQRMKALPDGPWRTFRGTGLNEILLARLVARFDLKPDRLPRKRGEKQIIGYRRTHINQAAKL